MSSAPPPPGELTTARAVLMHPILSALMYARIVRQVYAVLPAAAMFMVGYNWLSNHVGSRALFHLTITPFFAFYALFAFVMYPMRGVLHHAAGMYACVWGCCCCCCC